jgi:hypothetical protein
MRTWRPRVQDITKPTETARSKAQKEKSEHPLESSLSDHKIKKTHDAMLETPISKAPPRRRSSVGLNELLSRIDVLQDKASELNKWGDATRARLQLQAAETLAKRLDSVYPPPSFSSLMTPYAPKDALTPPPQPLPPPHSLKYALPQPSLPLMDKLRAKISVCGTKKHARTRLARLLKDLNAKELQDLYQVLEGTAPCVQVAYDKACLKEAVIGHLVACRRDWVA